MLKNSEITMSFHPRAFSAFGSELVTNDSVAMTELVKNSYDAFASGVMIVFGNDSDEHYIEIIDDGLGMSQEIVSTSWAVVATPFKKNNPSVERNGRIRYVSGNKGLGRFSAARLGQKMSIITKCKDDICFSAEIDWNSFENAEAINNCKIALREYPEQELLSCIRKSLRTDSRTGTIIRIAGLNEEWNYEKIESLKLALARLISPFEQVDDFKIFIQLGDANGPVDIRPHDFIKNPVYRISGYVSELGDVHWKYSFSPGGRQQKYDEGVIPWNSAKDGFDKGAATRELTEIKSVRYGSGEFSFEIRAWDLDSESVADISETFNIKKSEIRKTIAQYKGISVYRDRVLVLPKSDAAKDWLGVDIRRVSAIGKRISTSQIVGILSISAEKNPRLMDTTDREKLVDTEEYKQFCRVVESIILTLENKRNMDRQSNVPIKAPTLTELFTPLSPSRLESKVEMMVQSGQNAQDILGAIHEYREDAEKGFDELNNRLVYYAQTASLGSVAVVIMHEIRTAMNSVGRFIRRLKNTVVIEDEKTNNYMELADKSYNRLLSVADCFAPLCRKGLAREANRSDLKNAINNSIMLASSRKDAASVSIDVDVPDDMLISMHDGELQTIIINLLDNSIFWLQRQKKDKHITISAKKLSEKKAEINISDNGPGIAAGDEEKIFQPGITAKPQGIGMGLVIVTELLHNHDCSIKTVVPGDMGGATFIFDVPLEGRENT